jgi:hypothetical protein
MYICPVCGYERLPEAPLNFSICACCGTEFEFDDFGTTYAALRARWVASGCQWFSPCVHKPQNWSVSKQFENLQFVQKAKPDFSVVSSPAVSGDSHLKPYTHAY